jgi:hypothetical protein
MINVVKIENSETIHMVELELEVDDIAEKSRVINRFINSLISMFSITEKWLMHTLCGAWIKLCVGRASEADQSEPAHTSAVSGILGA